MNKVFTYGTLQIPEVMEKVTGRRFESMPARLDGYARYTIKQQVFPGIIAEPNAVVEGMVYYGVDDASLQCLDAFEDILYQRQILPVSQESGRTYSEAYVVNDDYLHLVTDEPWSLNTFRAEKLSAYLKSCERFRRIYNQTR